MTGSARNRPAPGAGFAGGFLSRCAEFAREFLEGAVFAGAERGAAGGGTERQHLAGCSAVLRRCVRRRLAGAAAVAPGGARAPASRSMSRQMPKPRKPANCRSRSNTGRPDISIGRRSPSSSTGQCDDDAAPGVVRGERGRDGALRVELKRGGDLRPRAVEHGRGLRPEQAHEFVGAEREAVGGIHLPDEAERQAARPVLGRGGFGGSRRRRIVAACVGGTAPAGAVKAPAAK